LQRLLQAARDGSRPVYAEPLPHGGSLLENTSLHRRVESLDRDLRTFLLVGELRQGSDDPTDIRDWVETSERSLNALLAEGWSNLPNDPRRWLNHKLKPFLLRMERLDELQDSPTDSARLIG
jgi:hypothetical protein